jgi:hypothetical protein
MIDPTAPFESAYDDYDNDYEPDSGQPADLSTLLQSQLRLAERLQKKLLGGGLNSMPAREMKELVNSLSTLLTLAHRTNQANEEIQTYKMFVTVVMDFLKRRGDSLGEDLAEELRQVGKEYAGAPVDLLS